MDYFVNILFDSSGWLPFVHINWNHPSNDIFDLGSRERVSYSIWFIVSLTVKDNIMLPLILNENDLKEGIKSVKKIAAEFGIASLLNKYPYELSGGEKQRTAICRAMIENPELILADEPTGNLDSNTSLQVIKTLVHINETLNKTVVMVTHDPKMASYGKKTFFLKDGVILDSLIKKESNEKYYEKILNKMVQI